MGEPTHVEENGIAKCANSVKQKRTTPLDNFQRIISSDSKIRLKSAVHVINNLKNDDENHSVKSYTIRRLVRGLGASRISSRIGFYTTLTVLLKRSNYDANAIFDIVESELHASKQNSKSENADILSGHILLTGAILRSGQFSDLEPDNKKKIIQLLIDASSKKSYLGLMGVSMLINSLEHISEDHFALYVLPLLRPQLKKELGDYSLDNLYLLLKLQETYPRTVNEKFLINLCGSSCILSEGNVNPIIDVLMNVVPIKNIDKHPIYEYIAAKLAKEAFLPKFLRNLDAKFVPTFIRRLMHAIILRHIVDNLTDNYESLKALFGHNYIGDMISYFRTMKGVKETEDDVKVAIAKLFHSVVERLKQVENSEIKILVMETLMFHPGTFMFQKITGSNILYQITLLLDAERVKYLADKYKHVALSKHQTGTTSETWWLNVDRIHAVQLLVKLINHPTLRGAEHVSWKQIQLKFILDLALLNREKISTDLIKPIKETFYSALNMKMLKLEDVIIFSSDLVYFLNDNLEFLRQPLEEEAMQVWKKTVELARNLEVKKKTHLGFVFHMLFLQMALQLFNDSKLAIDSLKELFECYERRKSNDPELNWIEVVVDLILNLLSHSSHLLRFTINRVFPQLCKYLTPSAIHQILHVIDPQNDNPLAVVDDSDEGEESECDNDEDDSDSSEDDESVEEESGEEDVDDEFEETQNDKLRLALHDALLNGKPLGDESDIDLDDMSDGECDKLNAALGEAFKRFRPNLGRHKNKKQSKDDEALTHFRVRVLDLIDIYLDSPEVSMLNCLEIMLPLLQSLEFSIKDVHQKPLLDRVKGSIKKLSSLKHFGTTADVTDEVLCTLLQSILDKGNKSALMYQEMGDKMSECCTFIITCANVLSMQESENRIKKSKIAKILVDALDDFFQRRDSLTPYVLFKNIMASQWKHTIALIPSLFSYTFNDTIRPFRRRQALELLKLFYLNNRLLAVHLTKYVKKLEASESEFLEKALALLSSTEYKVREPFIAGLFALLLAMKNCTLQNSNFDWSKIGETIREFRTGVAFTKDTKTAFNKLCGALKISNIVKMKKTVVSLSQFNSEQDKDDEEERQIKKKGNKEAKKLKKQARALRMSSLSEGMVSGITFATTDVDDLNAMDIIAVSSSDESDNEKDTGKAQQQSRKKALNHKKTKQKNGSLASTEITNDINSTENEVEEYSPDDEEEQPEKGRKNGKIKKKPMKRKVVSELLQGTDGSTEKSKKKKKV